MSLTKVDIVESIHNRCSYSRDRSAELLERILEIIKESLASGEDVLVSGFGKFSVKEKGKRKGRNPTTGADLTLAARRIVTFRVSPVLRRKLTRET